ncbi:MAG: ATP-binding protein, partial [Bacteroidales bacterium]
EQNIQFFTSISHEFKTPLSLIIGPLETLINSTRSKVKEQLLVILRNARRLLQLTNNLMDLRKLEEGITRLKIHHGDILKCTQEIAGYFTIRLNKRGITLHIDAGDAPVYGWFDAEKLETILLNLLSNAIKHTPDNGKITIKINCCDSAESVTRYPETNTKARPDIRYIEVMVIDYGTGILPEELPFVFDKFYQTQSGYSYKKSGTGIGLTLTKGLVELHRGTIRAESQPGKETRFVFMLPIDREAYAPGEIDDKPSKPEGVELSIDEYETFESGRDNLEEPAAKENRYKILIVEDNDELRAFLSNELSRTYNVIQAENGETGIKLALGKIPDLILSDVIMPGCSGIDLCKTVKTHVKTCHIPVILLTAKATAPDQIEGTETGADAYISKPFNLQLLYAKINQLILTRKKLYARFSQDVYILPNQLAEDEMDQAFLQRLIDYIIANISNNNLNVDQLADALNMSHSKLYRRVKRLSGKTLIEFIKIIRLKQAIILMESKKLTLAEIAYKTGFSSPAYFTKSFKDQYGKPPSEFMR